MKQDLDIILGIDPGFDRLGWAVGRSQSRQLTLINQGVIQTNKEQSLLQRYRQLSLEFSKLIKQYHPTQAAIEELFFSTNKKTALRVAEVRGVIIGELLRSGIEVFEYHPQSVKLAVTGHGKADKRAMARQLQLELGIDPKAIDDELDAVAIALTHTLTHGVS